MDDNIDLNVGGKTPERFMLMRHDELPEFTEEEAEAIKNFLPNRKDGDKYGGVLLLGTGGDTLDLHEAKRLFMDNKKFAADYLVSYDPIRDDGFSMENIVTGMREALSNLQDFGIVIKDPLSFRKIEGPGTVLWKKRVKTKNRYKGQTRKLVENFRKKDVSEYYARTVMLPPLDPDQNMLPDTVDKF